LLNIAFLFDLHNDWLEKHFHASINKRPDTRINIFHTPDQIENFDLVFVLGYTKILPESFLGSNDLVLLVHESDLPRGKGFSPMQWQILEGKNTITVCLIEMSLKVDSGDIIDQTKIRLNGTELYEELRLKQAEATFRLINKFLDSYPSFTRQPQTGKETSFPRRSMSDSEINIDGTIREQFNLLRVVNNEEWPAFFYFNGIKYTLKIFKENN